MSRGLELALPGERFESSYREALGEQGNPLAEPVSAYLARFADERAGRVAPDGVTRRRYWIPTT